MKNFLTLMAFVVAVFFTANASAASWSVVDESTEEGLTIITSVDKDSIQRGTTSKSFPEFNRKDGFSAVIKIEMKMDSGENIVVSGLISFYNEGGKRMYCLLDNLSENNTEDSRTSKDISAENVDTDGEIWTKIWAFAEKNLK